MNIRIFVDCETECIGSQTGLCFILSAKRAGDNCLMRLALLNAGSRVKVLPARL